MKKPDEGEIRTLHGEELPLPSHELEIEVTASDIDELGHASNVSYVRWVQDAAKSHSAAVGWGYSTYKELGAVFVVKRHELDYQGQCFAGEKLPVATFVESWSAATSVRKTVIYRADTGEVLLKASTIWALVTFDTGRPTRIVRELRRSVRPEGRRSVARARTRAGARNPRPRPCSRPRTRPQTMGGLLSSEKPPMSPPTCRWSSQFEKAKFDSLRAAPDEAHGDGRIVAAVDALHDSSSERRVTYLPADRQRPQGLLVVVLDITFTGGDRRFR